MLADFEETKKILQKYKLPLVESLLIETPEQGISFAQRHGFPVVLKILSSDVLHKTDKGLVRLNIRSEEQLCKELGSLQSASAPTPDIGAMPRCRVSGQILIQKQIEGGLELFIGMKRDASFGPVISVGLGGIFVEALGDIAFLIAPFSKSEVKQTLKSLKGYKILQGYRGQAPVNFEKLADILVNVSKLALDEPQIQEIDLNPLIADGDDILIVDPKLLTPDFGASDRSPTSASSPKSGFGALFNPKTVALIGATDRQGAVGAAIAKNLLAGAKQRKIFFVNPNRAKVLGEKTFKTICDIPAAIDLAIIAVPSDIVPLVSEQCAVKKVKGAIVISSGFAEIGKQGAALQEKIAAIFQQSKIPFLGPNCLGVVSPANNFNGSFAPCLPHKGGIALISQSGALIDNLIDDSLALQYGFSAMVSFGNEAGVKITDLLNYFSQDERTKVICLYVEAIQNGEEFVRIAKKVSNVKQIVILKGGKTEQGSKAALSHTAALAGNREIYAAAFKKAGIIEAKNLRELTDIAQALASQPIFKGGVGVLTNAGALGVLAADSCSQTGANLTKLLDILGDASPEKYISGMRDILRPKNAECLVVIVSFQFITQIDKIAKAIVNIKKEFPQKAILCCLSGGFFSAKAAAYLRGHSIPVFRTPEAAIIAASALSLPRLSKARV